MNIFTGIYVHACAKFWDNDNYRAKLRVINPSLAGISLYIVDVLQNRQHLNPHPTNQKPQTFEWNNLPSLGIRAIKGTKNSPSQARPVSVREGGDRMHI